MVGSSGEFLLAGAALKALSYPKTSLLGLHIKNAEHHFKTGGGQAAGQWLKNYHVGARKILNHVAKLPIAAQRSIHNHVLHGLTKNNPDLHLTKPQHVNDFVKGLKGVHDGLARHFGLKTNLGAPPKVSSLGARALGPIPAAPGPSAGASTAGIGRPVMKSAERGALGMNPLPPAMRHPTPLAMAPGPSGMPGAKELGAPKLPPMPPMGGQAPGGLHG